MSQYLLLYTKLLFSMTMLSNRDKCPTPAVSLKQDSCVYYQNKAEQAKVNAQFDSVFYYANKGYEIAKKTRTKSFMPYYYYYIALYYKIAKDYIKADSLVKKGAKEAFALKNYPLYEKITYLQAIIYLGMGNKRAGVNQIFNNLRPTRFIKTPKTNSANFLLLSNLYYELGEDSLWAYYLKKYITISDDYYKANKPVNIQDMDTFFLIELSLYYHNTAAVNKFLNQMQQIHRQNNLPFANYYNNLIMILNSANKFHNEKLVPRILSVINHEHFIQNIDPTQKATYYYQLAVVDVYNHDYKKARININKCFNSYKFITDLNPLVLEVELQILEHEKKYKEALLVYKSIRNIASTKKKNLKELEFVTLERKLADDYQDLRVSSIQQKVRIQYLENIRKQEQLQNANKKITFISLLSIGLLVMIVIYWRLGQKLRKQTKKLALLIENKDRIFSIIGHDLRGPIISILSLSPQINRPGFQLNQEKYLKNLLFTVDNLLQWSISQQEKIFPKRIEINVFDVIEEVLEELEAFIQLAEVDIRVSYNINDTIVVFDEYHLKIIIRNILHNAIKFTPKKGAIYIYTTHTDFLNIHIQDTGNGIGSSVHHTNARSTKIGLELVHKLIDLNKAKLKVVSQQGIGTNVSIIFWG